MTLIEMTLEEQHEEMVVMELVLLEHYFSIPLVVMEALVYTEIPQLVVEAVIENLTLVLAAVVVLVVLEIHLVRKQNLVKTVTVLLQREVEAVVVVVPTLKVNTEVVVDLVLLVVIQMHLAPTNQD